MKMLLSFALFIALNSAYAAQTTLSCSEGASYDANNVIFDLKLETNSILAKTFLEGDEFFEIYPENEIYQVTIPSGYDYDDYYEFKISNGKLIEKSHSYAGDDADSVVVVLAEGDDAFTCIEK